MCRSASSANRREDKSISNGAWSTTKNGVVFICISHCSVQDVVICFPRCEVSAEQALDNVGNLLVVVMFGVGLVLSAVIAVLGLVEMC